MKVLFAPDWRGGNPYQQLLADALGECGVEVDFADPRLTRFPLSDAAARSRPDILHLHWPDAFYPRIDPRGTLVRKFTFPFDLRAAARRARYVLTAHNLRPHGRGEEWRVETLTRFSYLRAEIVLAHGERACERVTGEYGVAPAKLRSIPHGDLSSAMPPPVSREEARARLQLGAHESICLMFGAVDPYKGIEEVIRYWGEVRPDCRLHVVGSPCAAEYAERLQRGIGSLTSARLHAKWVGDAELVDWLCASDAAVFNYRTVFASGAASLARSFGLPVLLPARADTVELGEPSPMVARFDGLDDTFAEALERMLAVPGGWEAAADWREATAWPAVARRVADAYSALL